MSRTIPILSLSAILLLSLPAWAGDHQGDDAKLHGQANAVVHGKKKGWRGCNLPPGQAKKYGCPTVVHAAPAPPPPPGVHRTVVVTTPVRVVAPPPPPPPRTTVVVTAPAIRVVTPPPPPPPSVGVQVHVDATIHP